MDEAEARARKRSYERQMADKRSKIAGIDGKIRRLREAYDKIGDAKNEVRSNVARYQNAADACGAWTGNLRDRFNEAADEVGSSRDAYLRRADECRDAIRDAITRLENRKADMNGAIGSLQRLWNDVVGWLAKQTD